MKMDAAKRNIFMDAVNLLSPRKQAATGNGIEMLDIDVIKAFRYHPFHLYEGDGWMIWRKVLRSMGSESCDRSENALWI